MSSAWPAAPTPWCGSANSRSIWGIGTTWKCLEQMMIEMLARPEFLRDHLSLAMEVEKLILRNRENKMGFEEKYSRMSRESAEMHRLKEWVSYVLASPSAALAKA